MMTRFITNYLPAFCKRRNPTPTNKSTSNGCGESVQSRVVCPEVKVQLSYYDPSGNDVENDGLIKKSHNSRVIRIKALSKKVGDLDHLKEDRTYQKICFYLAKMSLYRYTQQLIFADPLYFLQISNRCKSHGKSVSLWHDRLQAGYERLRISDKSENFRIESEDKILTEQDFSNADQWLENARLNIDGYLNKLNGKQLKQFDKRHPELTKTWEKIKRFQFVPDLDLLEINRLDDQMAVILDDLVTRQIKQSGNIERNPGEDSVDGSRLEMCNAIFSSLMVLNGSMVYEDEDFYDDTSWMKHGELLCIEEENKPPQQAPNHSKKTTKKTIEKKGKPPQDHAQSDFQPTSSSKLVGSSSMHERGFFYEDDVDDHWESVKKKSKTKAVLNRFISDYDRKKLLVAKVDHFRSSYQNKRGELVYLGDDSFIPVESIENKVISLFPSDRKGKIDPHATHISISTVDLLKGRFHVTQRIGDTTCHYYFNLDRGEPVRIKIVDRRNGCYQLVENFSDIRQHNDNHAFYEVQNLARHFLDNL